MIYTLKYQNMLMIPVAVFSFPREVILNVLEVGKRVCSLHWMYCKNLVIFLAGAE